MNPARRRQSISNFKPANLLHDRAGGHMHVNLQRHVHGAIQEFERAIGECPEVVECFSATGEADYLLKVIVPDIKTFDTYLNLTLFTMPAVANARTSVVLRQVKHETALPV